MPVFESYNLLESNSLFEIPIYRLSPTKFKEELERKVDKWSSGNPLSFFEQHYDKVTAKGKFEANRSWYRHHIGYLWKFNEIIGYILLNIDRDIFSGECFINEKEKIRRNSKGKISYKGEAFRFNIDPIMTDSQIYGRIVKELKSLKTNLIVKGRFIDTNRFETVGRYISWQRMFAEINN